MKRAWFVNLATVLSMGLCLGCGTRDARPSVPVTAATASPEGARAVGAASGRAASDDAAATARRWLEISKVAFTPEELGRAVGACDVEKVKLFLSAGMDPNVHVSSLGTAVQLSISRAAYSTEESCPQVFGLLVRAGGKIGGEELLEVAGLGNRSYLEVAVGSKVDLNATGANGVTAAMLAAGTRNLGMMETLRDAGADLNRQDDQGKTALMYAVEKGDPDMVGFMIATPGLDLGRKDRFGRTALAQARFQDQARMGAPSPWHDVMDVLVKAQAPE
jgi:hypothetical protein